MTAAAKFWTPERLDSFRSDLEYFRCVYVDSSIVEELKGCVNASLLDIEPDADGCTFIKLKRGAELRDL